MRLIESQMESVTYRYPLHISGDKSKTCGGEGLLQTYYKPTVKVEAPSKTDKSYAGCYVDGSITAIRNPDWSDVDGCRTYCKDKKTKYFGVQRGRYCYCDNEITTPQGWQSRVPESECESASSHLLLGRIVC
jgi:hypothetical protein